VLGGDGVPSTILVDDEAILVTVVPNEKFNAATNTRSLWLPEQPVEPDSDAEEKISTD